MPSPSREPSHTCIGPKADRLAAEEDGAAELAGEEAQRVGGVGRGERDVVEVVAVGHERGQARRRCRPAVRRAVDRRAPARPG